jgi:hypothetical protein
LKEGWVLFLDLTQEMLFDALLCYTMLHQSITNSVHAELCSIHVAFKTKAAGEYAHFMPVIKLTSIERVVMGAATGLNDGRPESAQSFSFRSLCFFGITSWLHQVASHLKELQFDMGLRDADARVTFM